MHARKHEKALHPALRLLIMRDLWSNVERETCDAQHSMTTRQRDAQSGNVITTEAPDYLRGSARTFTTGGERGSGDEHRETPGQDNRTGSGTR